MAPGLNNNCTHSAPLLALLRLGSVAIDGDPFFAGPLGFFQTAVERWGINA